MGYSAEFMKFNEDFLRLGGVHPGYSLQREPSPNLYYLFRKAGCPDIYVHLDCHDDISLVARPGRIGDFTHASFVGHLIRDGVAVVFYGTNYWSHQMLLFGRSATCYLRNNLFVYDPFKVHFLDFSRYLMACVGVCRMVGVEGVRSYIEDCLDSGKIEEIYVNEDLGLYHDRVKFYRYGKDIIVPNLSELLPVDRDLAPGLIVRWDGSDVADFKGLTAYLSVDLDVLIEDCQVD
ncbi:MAG: hypothetical protein DRN68_08495, partial [Thaumarchaeota archaeon]